MNYGVKFDILVNGTVAANQLRLISTAAAQSMPKTIAHINNLTAAMSRLNKQLSRNAALKGIGQGRINIDTKAAEAKITRLSAKIAALQAQMAGAAGGAVPPVIGRGRGGAMPGGGRGGRYSGVSGFRKRVAPNGLFAGIGVPMAAMGITAMVTAGTIGLIKNSAIFEAEMTNVRNILRSTDKEAETFGDRFDNVSKRMRQIGLDTKYRNVEIAGAMKYLAMAGQDLEAIDKSMRPITSLAAISDVPLEQIADLATNIMAAWKISPDSIEAVSDILAGVAMSSNTTIPEMAEAYKMAGGALKLAGQDFAESSAMLGVLANAGIKGTLAGTGLRAAMMRLAKPTARSAKALKELGVEVTYFEDGQQKLKSFVDILEDIRNKGGTITELYQIFDKIAGTPAAMLINNLEQVRELADFTRNFGGGAEFLALEKMKTLPGIWEKIISKIQDTAQDSFDKIEGRVKNLLNTFLDWLNTPDAAKFMDDIYQTLMGFVEGIATIVKLVHSNWDWLKWLLGGAIVYKGVSAVIGGIASAIAGVTSALIPMGGAAAGASGAMSGMFSSPAMIGWAALATAVALVGIEIYTSQKAAREWYEEMTNHDAVGWTFIDDVGAKAKNASSALGEALSKMDAMKQLLASDEAKKSVELSPQGRDSWGLGGFLINKVQHPIQEAFVGWWKNKEEEIEAQTGRNLGIGAWMEKNMYASRENKGLYNHLMYAQMEQAGIAGVTDEISEWQKEIQSAGTDTFKIRQVMDKANKRHSQLSAAAAAAPLMTIVGTPGKTTNPAEGKHALQTAADKVLEQVQIMESLYNFEHNPTQENAAAFFNVFGKNGKKVFDYKGANTYSRIGDGEQDNSIVRGAATNLTAAGIHADVTSRLLTASGADVGALKLQDNIQFTDAWYTKMAITKDALTKWREEYKRNHGNDEDFDPAIGDAMFKQHHEANYARMNKQSSPSTSYPVGGFSGLRNLGANDYQGTKTGNNTTFNIQELVVPNAQDPDGLIEGVLSRTVNAYSAGSGQH